MAVTILEFFGLVGLDLVAPTCVSELIPWLATLLVGALLVCGVLRLVGIFVRTLFNWRRY